MSDFISYNDWLGANRDPTGGQAQLDKASAGSESAVGDALKAGQTGGDPTASQGAQKLANYGDFLKQVNTGNYADAAGALGGGATGFDAMLLKGNDSQQLQAAQQAYNQQAAGVGAAYASGAANKNADQTGYLKGQQAAGFGIQGNTAAAQQMRADQLKAGKAAQQSARDAGAKYRLGKEREAFEESQKSRDNTLRGISDVLNPIGGLADMAGEWNRGFGGNDGTVFGKGASFIQDPFGLGGNAHSGFGPGGKFGSPLGMGDAAQGDPLGKYSNDDSGFAAWLAKNGYSSTGEGNGY